MTNFKKISFFYEKFVLIFHFLEIEISINHNMLIKMGTKKQLTPSIFDFQGCFYPHYRRTTKPVNIESELIYAL